MATSSPSMAAAGGGPVTPKSDFLIVVVASHPESWSALHPGPEAVEGHAEDNLLGDAMDHVRSPVTSNVLSPVASSTPCS